MPLYRGNGWTQAAHLWLETRSVVSYAKPDVENPAGTETIEKARPVRKARYTAPDLIRMGRDFAEVMLKLHGKRHCLPPPQLYHWRPKSPGHEG